MRSIIIIGMIVAAGCDSPGEEGTSDVTIASDTIDGDVVVVCPDGFTGPDCDSCLPGHVRGDDGRCRPVEVDCTTDPGICGAFGRCDFIFVTPEEGDPVLPTESVCTCDEGHTGTFCEQCEDGWQRNGMLGVCRMGCALAALDCQNPRICDDSSGVATCVCPEGTTGPDCGSCALGFVWDGDACVRGTVPEPTPSCETIADLGGCGRGACHGGACVCEPGFTGPRCDACLPGHEGEDCSACEYDWMRLGDGPCRPSCHPNADSCGPNGYCWDQETMSAECECEPGYTGPTCEQCVAGFTREGDECLVDFAPTERFFTIAVRSDRLHLGVIDTVSGDVRLVRTLDELGFSSGSNSVKLAWDKARGRLYTRGQGSGTLWSIEPRTWVKTEVATLVATSYMPVVAYDPTRDRVIVMEDRRLVAVDPTTGSKTTLDDIGELGSVNELFMDVTNDRLLVGHFGQGQQGYFITAVDPDDYTQTEVAELPDDFTLQAGNQMGLALDDDGALIVASGKRRTYADQRPTECRQEAFRVTGDDAYLTAPVRFLELADETTVVTSLQTSGPELVAVGDFFDARSTIDIATTNPDIVICPPWYFFEEVTLRLAASARFRAMPLASSDVTLVVEAGFPTDVARVHVPYVEGAQAPALNPSLVDNPVVRLYTEEEWQSRRLGSSGAAGESWETNALRAGGWARGAVDMSAPFTVRFVDGMDLTGLAGPR